MGVHKHILTNPGVAKLAESVTTVGLVEKLFTVWLIPGSWLQADEPPNHTEEALQVTPVPFHGGGINGLGCDGCRNLDHFKGV
jgi:hypothetical protein